MNNMRNNNLTSKITTDSLRTYVEANEVVYQFCGELMEVSNGTEMEQIETILGYFPEVRRVEVYTKHDKLAKDSWPELSKWAKDDDVLFLLDGIDMLICIPKKKALANNLIEA